MSRKIDPWQKFVVKEKDLVMRLGDHLRLIADVDTNDEEAGVSMHTKAAGQLYEAADRKGAGWDLVKLSGEGPDPLRVLNGDVLTYFEILPQGKEQPPVGNYLNIGDDGMTTYGLPENIKVSKRRKTIPEK